MLIYFKNYIVNSLIQQAYLQPPLQINNIFNLNYQFNYQPTAMRPFEQNFNRLIEIQKTSKSKAQHQSPKIALSNKQNGSMQEAQTMYVKEFFQHFFQKKSMLQVLSEISNGIQVIETLITNFYNQKGLKHNSKMATKRQIQLNGDFPNVIQREGRQISECVEGLYLRLQTIFEQWGVGEREADEFPKLFKSEVSGDEQLYDMLSSLKQKCSKEKMLRESADRRCKELQKNIIAIEDQKKRLTKSLKSREQQGKQLSKTISEFQDHVKSLNQRISQMSKQKDQLSEKLTVLFEINQNLANIEKENEELNVNLKRSQQNQIKLTRKFDALQGIIKEKIKQRDDKWMSMIGEKLSSTTLFSNASCNAFRQFMISLSTLNK